MRTEAENAAAWRRRAEAAEAKVAALNAIASEALDFADGMTPAQIAEARKGLADTAWAAKQLVEHAWNLAIEAAAKHIRPSEEEQEEYAEGAASMDLEAYELRDALADELLSLKKEPG